MKITAGQMKAMKSAPNSAYGLILPEFLFHSNRMEGSTFSEDELFRLVEDGHVVGDHTKDDVYETINSIALFDHMVDGLGSPITPGMLVEMNRMLFAGTTDEADGFTGHYKEIPNRIVGSRVQVALPSDVEQGVEDLLGWWEESPRGPREIVLFHVRFEHLHPFQNGNGRIGRVLMLKQCIEQEADLIVIDEAHGDEYKSYLEIAQMSFDGEAYGPRELSVLGEVLERCAARFARKMGDLGVPRLLPPSL